MENTIGYILCCQSPALFLLAIALLIRFFVRKGKARVRAIVSLIAALACIAAGVVLYYQGLLLEYFTLRTLWQIRTAGWIGLAMVAALLLFISGIILSSQLAKDARDFEFQLQTVHHWHSEKK